MIGKRNKYVYGTNCEEYRLYCDSCSYKSFPYMSFNDVVKFKKNEAKTKGWTCIKTKDGFKDLCWKCNKKLKIN